MIRSAVLAFIVLHLMACGGGEVVLDCTAFCSRAACAGTGTDTCEEDCLCSDVLLRTELKQSINECGTEPTCGEQEACVDRQPEPPPRAIEDEVRGACADYALRCGQDAQQVCGVWALDGGTGLQSLLDEDLLQRWIGCYESPCAEVDSCIEGIQSPACRAAEQH